jgi:cysteine-rich repeat protein
VRHCIPAILAALVPAALAACVAGGADPARVEREGIVGGAEEARFTYTGAIVVDHGGGAGSIFCTGVAVTPTVVVSAAHCLDQFDDTGGEPVVFLTVDESGGTAYRTMPETRARHPSWPGDVAYDLGAFAIRSPIPLPVFPLLRSAAVGAAEVGTALQAVGFGETSPSAGDAGTRRSVTMNVAEAQGPYFVVRSPDGWPGVCNGDSGGPSLQLGGMRETLWGIHARDQNPDTCGAGEDTSVGDLYGAFLEASVLVLDPAARQCGDGVCTGLETATGCPADCPGVVCGDAAVESPEVCDDGNTASGDGCSADCLSDETCGNAIVDGAAGEVCDDGNAVSGDGCSGDCLVAEGCGNGVLEPAFGEVCDDGNTIAGDGCAAGCRSDETCGNGVVDLVTGEVCDDGNALDGDACPASCGVVGGIDGEEGGCSCRMAGPRAAAALRRLAP